MKFIKLYSLLICFAAMTCVFLAGPGDQGEKKDHEANEMVQKPVKITSLLNTTLDIPYSYFVILVPNQVWCPELGPQSYVMSTIIVYLLTYPPIPISQRDRMGLMIEFLVGMLASCEEKDWMFEVVQEVMEQLATLRRYDNVAANNVLRMV